MAGVAENLNVRITLKQNKLATKVVCRQNNFPAERLFSDFSTPPWELYSDSYNCLLLDFQALQLTPVSVTYYGAKHSCIDAVKNDSHSFYCTGCLRRYHANIWVLVMSEDISKPHVTRKHLKAWRCK